MPGVGLADRRQDFGAVGRDRDRMLEVGRQAVVDGDHRPAVSQQGDVLAPGVDHRFDRQHHAGLEQRPLAGDAEVWHLGILVHVPPDAVPDEAFDNGKSGALHVLLDGGADVANPVSDLRLADSCWASTEILPMPTVRPASAQKPRWMRPASRLSRSPSRSLRFVGMPCTTWSLTEVQMAFWYP